MKRLWLILLIVSCTTAPKMDYDGMAEQTQEKRQDGEDAVSKNLIGKEEFEKGINDLNRTAEGGGTFCYTFFKGIGTK